ncbi:MAG TPA: tetraacyldisaccharide 4'-kinase [Alphaproteobacteria bacterium]|nr:tetraacyldisaccharide 4'-kinase [Alphaproteobacteria bacterium]
MRAPAFWGAPPGLAAALLAPLGAAYAGAGRLRRRLAAPERAGVPVLCIGNLVAGGAGKTPVALAVARALRGQGHDVHFLSRGYGGRERGPLRVDPVVHDAAAVGDEPLLLAEMAPAWVARDRAAGARAAAAAGAGMLVLDDGFQNPALAKDLSLLVVDGGYGIGNGRVMPAGPLREPMAEGLARADAVVLIGEDERGLAPALGGAGPLLRARLMPEPGMAAWLKDRRVVAFAGIGRPEKFFATLRGLGAVAVSETAFPDHHPYRPEEVMTLVERAAALGAAPVTTRKDLVRLPREAQAMVHALPVAVAWEEPARLDRLLRDRFGQADG